MMMAHKVDLFTQWILELLLYRMTNLKLTSNIYQLAQSGHDFIKMICWCYCASVRGSLLTVSVSPAARARARARSPGGSVSSRRHQGETVGSTSSFRSVDPALPVERRAAPRRPVPFPVAIRVHRASRQSQGPAAAGECDYYFFFSFLPSYN